MSEIGDKIQEKCLAFGDRIIKLNDYLLAQAVAAHENYKKSRLQARGKKTSSIIPLTSDISVASVPVYLQSISNLCNQLLRAGTSIGANNAEPTNEARAETKLAWAMPCKEEEDEVNLQMQSVTQTIVRSHS